MLLPGRFVSSVTRGLYYAKIHLFFFLEVNSNTRNLQPASSVGPLADQQSLIPLPWCCFTPLLHAQVACGKYSYIYGYLYELSMNHKMLLHEHHKIFEKEKEKKEKTPSIISCHTVSDQHCSTRYEEESRAGCWPHQGPCTHWKHLQH